MRDRDAAEALRQAGAADALQPGEAEATGARHRLFDAVDAALTDRDWQVRQAAEDLRGD